MLNQLIESISVLESKEPDFDKDIFIDGHTNGDFDVSGITGEGLGTFKTKEDAVKTAKTYQKNKGRRNTIWFKGAEDRGYGMLESGADEAMDLDTALYIMRKEVKNHVALTYIDAMGQARAQYGDEGVRVQVLYILNNLSGWRGETAKKVKAFLKAFAKIK